MTLGYKRFNPHKKLFNELRYSNTIWSFQSLTIHSYDSSKDQVDIFIGIFLLSKKIPFFFFFELMSSTHVQIVNELLSQVFCLNE